MKCLQKWQLWLLAIGVICSCAGATVYRTMDAESASIDADDWELHDNGYDFLAVTKGEPQAPWISPSQYYTGTHGFGYDIYPTSGLYDGQTMDKINHRIIYGGDTGAIGFNEVRYTSYYVKLSDSHFEIPEGICILVQWWQGSPHNPPLSLQVLPGTTSPEFAFFCKDDETGGTPSETARMIFQGDMPIGQWHHFIVKTKMNYIDSGNKAEIKVWHNGKLLSSLVNSGYAYTGYCGYKPASLGGITGANNKLEPFIGIYRQRQWKRTQVFFDDVVLSNSYSEPTGSYEDERYDLASSGITIEAENSSDIVSPMAVSGGGGSSGGQYISVPEGTGNGSGDATYHLEIPADDYYYVWARTYAPDAGSNSVFVHFNSDSDTEFGLREDTFWRWNVVGPFYLYAGINTMTIGNREDGTKIDLLHVGTFYQSPPVSKVGFFIEAENGQITSPMEVQSISTASAGNFIVTPNGTGNGTGGQLKYNFDLEEAASLYVWARVFAPTGADNSFYIRQQGMTFADWHLSYDDTNWIWQKYGTAFSFSAGGNNVIIGTREDGTEADRIYIGDEDPRIIDNF